MEKTVSKAEQWDGSDIESFPVPARPGNTGKDDLERIDDDYFRSYSEGDRFP